MKLVIVERDGPVNDPHEGLVRSPEEWLPQPGALDAIALLNHAGFTVVLAAHWPALGRGQLDMATLNAIHARMHKQLSAAGGRVDAIFFCPHAPDEDCDCRPPQPGLFRRIGERYKQELAQVYAVVANASTAQAAGAAGCRVQWVRGGHDAPAPGAPLPPGTGVHADLAALAGALVAAEEAAHPEPRPA